MADESKIIETALGPLPEELGLPEIREAKLARLREELARAHDIWPGAKDDEEGQILRLCAYQAVLGAVWEYVKADVPSEHLYLLVRLTEHLYDLRLGRRPEELEPVPRPKRANPGLQTHRATTLATACAMVDVLSEDRGKSLIENIEEGVAQAIGEQAGAFRSWRKAFNAGRKGPQAREAYGEIRRMLQESPDPKQATRGLLETHRRTLKKFV